MLTNFPVLSSYSALAHIRLNDIPAYWGIVALGRIGCCFAICEPVVRLLKRTSSSIF
jgi:hypothetical protein